MNEQSPIEVVDVLMPDQTDIALVVREEQAEVAGSQEAETNTDDGSQFWAAQQLVRGVVDNASDALPLAISDEGMTQLSNLPLTSLESLLESARIEAAVEAAVRTLDQTLDAARIFNVGMETVLASQPPEPLVSEAVAQFDEPVTVAASSEQVTDVREAGLGPVIQSARRAVALPAATLRELIPVQARPVTAPELPKLPETPQATPVDIAPVAEAEAVLDGEATQPVYDVAGRYYEEVTGTARVTPDAATLELFKEPEQQVAPGTVIRPEPIATEPVAERGGRVAEDQPERPRQTFEAPQFVPVTVETIAADLESTLQRALQLTTRDDLHEYMAQRPQRDIAARTYFTVHQASQGVVNVVSLLALSSQLDDPASAQTTPVDLPMLQSFVQQLLSLV
ncbi:MAG: hypothetical protein JWM81_770 [Candidatus Saccharibacteria bacterium]|nr:hypothetical protein [Candidatus Saccharibacteria bacterium]